MVLAEPPGPNGLGQIRAVRGMGNRTLYRAHRSENGPWWFAERAGGDDPEEGGRFDLMPPYGACYWADSPLGAIAEVLQDWAGSIVPIDELRVRSVSMLSWPRGAPPVADLTDAKLLGSLGVNASLWASAPGQRALTQRWAEAVRRDGWWSMRTRLLHDAEVDGITMFDTSGAHEPTWHGLEGDWTVETTPADAYRDELEDRFGFRFDHGNRALPPADA